MSDLRMRQVTWIGEFGGKCAVLYQRSMKKSQQGSLFSYFKPVNKISKAESSHQSPVAKTNGVKTSVR